VPERSRKKRPADLNSLAASIVGDATDPQREPTVDAVKAAASLLGKKGGKKGGPARAAKLTPEQRQETARKAAAARWQRSGQDA
jgi:hypothetical protein